MYTKYLHDYCTVYVYQNHRLYTLNGAVVEKPHKINRFIEVTNSLFCAILDDIFNTPNLPYILARTSHTNGKLTSIVLNTSLNEIVLTQNNIMIKLFSEYRYIIDYSSYISFNDILHSIKRFEVLNK